MRPIAPRTGAPEVHVGEEQQQYLELPAAIYGDNADAGPITILTRWRLTEEERQALLAGEDLYVGVRTFGEPLQPLHLSVGPEAWVEPGEVPE